MARVLCSFDRGRSASKLNGGEDENLPVSAAKGGLSVIQQKLTLVTQREYQWRAGRENGPLVGLRQSP